jgi:hypothetical protein
LLLLRLIGQKKPLFLQAESEADLDAWLTALTEAIGVSLNEQCSDLMQNQAVCLCVAATLLSTLVDCLFVCLFVVLARQRLHENRMKKFFVFCILCLAIQSVPIVVLRV